MGSIRAKGRSNGLEAGVVAAAKAQSLQIGTIDGLTPICRVGLAAYFACTGLRFAAEDPIGAGSRKVDITADKFVARYDISLQQLIRTRASNARRQIDGHPYAGTEYPEADLFLSFVGEQGDRRRRNLSETAYLGADGLLIELGRSWREDKMRQQPQLR